MAHRNVDVVIVVVATRVSCLRRIVRFNRGGGDGDGDDVGECCGENNGGGRGNGSGGEHGDNRAANESIRVHQSTERGIQTDIDHMPHIMLASNRALVSAL